MSENPKLESLVAQHDVELRALGTKLTDLDGDVKALSRDVAEGFRSLREGAKTDWSTMAAWATVLLLIVSTVGGLALQGVYQSMQNTRDDVDELRQARGERQVYDRDLAKVSGEERQRLRALERTVTQLDIMLQREMRILDDNITQSVANLDERLQREMVDKLAPIGTNIVWLKSELNGDGSIIRRLNQHDDRLQNLGSRLQRFESHLEGHN